MAKARPGVKTAPADDSALKLLRKRYSGRVPLYEKWFTEDQDFARWLERVPSDHSKVEYFYYLTRFHELTGLTPQDIVKQYLDPSTKQDFVDTVSGVIEGFRKKGTLSVGRMIWAAVCSLLMQRGAIRYFREFEISEPKSDTIEAQYIPTDAEFESMLHYAECKRDQFLLAFSRFGGGRRGTLDDPEPLPLRNVLDLDLTGLQTGEVKFKQPTSCPILVYGTVQDDKREAITRYKDTYVLFLLPQAMQYMKEYLEERLRNGEKLTGSSYLFALERVDKRAGGYLTATRATGTVSEISKRAGFLIPGTNEAKFTVHSLRRLFYNSLQGIDDVDKEALDGHVKGVRARYHGTVDEMKKAVEFMRGKYEFGMRTYITGTTDPLSSGQAKISAAISAGIRDPKIINDMLTDAERSAQINLARQVEAAKEGGVRHMVTSFNDVIRIRLSQLGQERRSPTRPARIGHATNGATPVDTPYETSIVGEDGLVPLLNEGWEIVKELKDGRLVLRRPNGLDE